MLWTIFVILMVMWLLGFGFHVGGGLIHILLVVAVIWLVWNLLSRSPIFFVRRPNRPDLRGRQDLTLLLLLFRVCRPLAVVVKITELVARCVFGQTNF